MKLPYGVTVADIEAICKFLLDKPAGAGIEDTLAVFEKVSTRKRKLTSSRHLGFIKSDGKGTVQITRRGACVAVNAGEHRTRSYLGAISDFPAYKAVIEGVVRREIFTINALEVASFWQDRFPSEVSTTPSDLNSQTICFLRLLEGAGLGRMTLGTPGQPTRFGFDVDKSRAFVEAVKRGIDPVEALGDYPGEHEAAATSGENTAVEVKEGNAQHEKSDTDSAAELPAREGNAQHETSDTDSAAELPAREGNAQHEKSDADNTGELPATEAPGEPAVREEVGAARQDVSGAGRIFITNDGREQILNQTIELVAFGKFEAVVEQSLEPSARFIDVMRSCQAAVIHASADRQFLDEDGKEARIVSENALIALGTAMALFDRNVILLVENGVELPAALPDLRVCRLSGGGLDGAAIMTLMKALGDLESG